MPAGFIPTRFIASEMEATIQAFFAQAGAVVKLTERGEPAGYTITIPDGGFTFGDATNEPIGEPYRYRITITEETRSRVRTTKEGVAFCPAPCNHRLHISSGRGGRRAAVSPYCIFCSKEFDKDGYQL